MSKLIDPVPDLDDKIALRNYLDRLVEIIETLLEEKD